MLNDSGVQTEMLVFLLIDYAIKNQITSYNNSLKQILLLKIMQNCKWGDLTYYRSVFKLLF